MFEGVNYFFSKLYYIWIDDRPGWCALYRRGHELARVQWPAGEGTHRSTSTWPWSTGVRRAYGCLVHVAFRRASRADGLKSTSSSGVLPSPAKLPAAAPPVYMWARPPLHFTPLHPPPRSRSPGRPPPSLPVSLSPGPLASREGRGAASSS